MSKRKFSHLNKEFVDNAVRRYGIDGVIAKKQLKEYFAGEWASLLPATRKFLKFIAFMPSEHSIPWVYDTKDPNDTLNGIFGEYDPTSLHELPQLCPCCVQKALTKMGIYQDIELFELLDYYTFRDVSEEIAIIIMSLHKVFGIENLKDSESEEDEISRM